MKMQEELLKQYKRIYHKRVDKVTVQAFLLVLKRQNIDFRELSESFGVNNKDELLTYLKQEIRGEK